MKIFRFTNDSADGQGSTENLRGPGQNICNDCFNRVFDCSIRECRSSWGPQAEWGPGQNAPVAPPPPLGGPADGPTESTSGLYNKNGDLRDTFHISS